MALAKLPHRLARFLAALQPSMREAGRNTQAMVSVRAGGSEPGQLDVASLRSFVRNEVTRWQKVATTAGVKPE